MPYNFPVDGEYLFEAKLYRTNLNIMRGLEFAHEVEITVGGEMRGACCASTVRGTNAATPAAAPSF